MNDKKERYDAIDGLRAFAAIGIVIMHVKENTNYSINGFLYNDMIPSFTNFVFLFMIISSFSMCCGYYNKIINNQINVEKFYKKRFVRILPFFALLSFIDLIIAPSINSLYEVFANLTLCFGFLPNANISVIGVGWFIGLVFVFYITFPFYCYLISNKVRVWMSFAIALVFNYLCTIYFFDSNHILQGTSGRTNIVYSAVFFIAGGLIYVYRDKLKGVVQKHRWLSLFTCIVISIAYYMLDTNVLILLTVNAVFLIYALGVEKSLLINKFTKFLSNVSLEIYLSHMVIFRVLEKMHLLNIFNLDILSYITTSLITIIGAVVFSITVRKVLFILESKMDNCINKRLYVKEK